MGLTAAEREELDTLHVELLERFRTSRRGDHNHEKFHINKQHMNSRVDYLRVYDALLVSDGSRSPQWLNYINGTCRLVGELGMSIDEHVTAELVTAHNGLEKLLRLPTHRVKQTPRTEELEVFRTLLHHHAPLLLIEALMKREPKNMVEVADILKDGISVSLLDGAL